MEIESIVARNRVMAALPAQIIKVEESGRASKFETIVEERISLDEECVASIVTFGEMAPAPVIPVGKQAFQSSLDTIWEDTMQCVAEYFVSEAADAFLRSTPVSRLSYLENLPSQFCIDSRGGLVRSSEF